VKHLWRNKEAISQAMELLGELAFTAWNRRLTHKEVERFNVLLETIYAWINDLPDQITFRQQVRNWWKSLWSK
jgi:hypothetical protein